MSFGRTNSAILIRADAIEHLRLCGISEELFAGHAEAFALRKAFWVVGGYRTFVRFLVGRECAVLIVSTELFLTRRHGYQFSDHVGVFHGAIVIRFIFLRNTNFKETR